MARKVLYNRYAARLYPLCCRYTKDSDAGKDLLHDALIKAFDKIGGFNYRGEGSLYAWLRKIAVNMAIERIRKEGRLSFSQLNDDIYAAAAIAVLAVLLPYQSADINIINDTGIPDTDSELLAQYDSTETIIYPSRKRNFTIADQGTADQVAIAEKPESSTEGSINEEKMDEAQTARLLDNKEHPYYDNSTEEIYTRDRKKIVLSSRLGGLSSRASSGIRGINSSGMGIPYMVGANGGTTIHHSIPITFGLDIGFLIQERFVLTSGIEASVYKSEFSYSGDVGGSRGIEQTAWFIGIPLKLEYTVWEADRFSSWIGTGGKVDRCIYATIDLSDRESSYVHG